MRTFNLILLLLFCVSVVFSQQYNATWESLDSRPLPSWFDQAKFGIFIHWGVFSVPSWGVVGDYAEWYWERLETNGSQTQSFHAETYGPDFPYQDFAHMFTAEMWDVESWVDIIKRSGAKYVVPTSKHHEGFTMWPSAQSWNWNAYDIGPKRDVIKELLDEVRKQGLHAGLYFSLYEWFHPLYRGSNPEEYVDEIMIPQLYDIVNKYSPEIIWGDGDWEHDSDFWKSKDFLTWLYNESPVRDTVVVNDRWGSDTAGKHGGFYTPEYSSTVYNDHKWEENSGIDIHSYGYNRNTPAIDYYTAYQLLSLLVRSVAYGGNLLLNIGPTWDGRIPNIMQERLLQMGTWLGVNGEAIYNSTKWRVQQETLIDSPTEFTVVRQNFNNVYGQVQPGKSSSTIVYYSKTATSTDCQYLCGNDSSCLSWTWHPSTAGSYSLMCYGRNDSYWDPVYETGMASGRKDHYTISYTYNSSTKNIYGIIDFYPSELYVNFPSLLPSSDPTSSTVEFVGYGPVEWTYDSSQGVIVKLPIISPLELPCLWLWTFKFENFS